MDRTRNRRCESLTLFVALLLALCLAPLLGDAKIGFAILIATSVGLAAAGGYALLRDRRWLVVFGVCIAISLGCEALIRADQPLVPWRIVSVLAALATYALLFLAVSTHSFFNARASTGDRLLSGICGYLLIVFWWSHVVLLTEAMAPQSFVDPQAVGDGPLPRFGATYFSMVTVSTLGYGDIVPVTQWARLVGGVAGLSGTLYLAVFIAAIISGLGSPKRDRESGEGR